MPPEEFEKIFKPFYRVDETRTRATGGTGLGLTIVANVVNEHQGKVWAEQSNLGWACCHDSTSIMETKLFKTRRYFHIALFLFIFTLLISVH